MVAFWYFFGSLHRPIPVRCNWSVFARKMHSTTEFAMTVLSTHYPNDAFDQHPCFSERVYIEFEPFWSPSKIQSCSGPLPLNKTLSLPPSRVVLSQTPIQLSSWYRMLRCRQRSSCVKHSDLWILFNYILWSSPADRFCILLPVALGALTLKSWDPQPESWLEYWLSLMLQGWEWNLEAHQSSMKKQNAGAVTHGRCNGFQKFKNRLAMVDQLLRQSPVLFSTPCYGSYSVRWCFLLSEIWTDPNTFSLYAFQPAGNLQIRGCKKASGSLKIAVQCVSRSCLVKLSLERFFSEGIPFGGHGGNPALMERT